MNRLARFTVLAFLLAAHSVHASPIGKTERDLVAIVNLSALAKIKPTYRYEERRAVRKIRRDLGEEYRRIHILDGKRATHDDFLKTLAAVENDPAVKAIDVIVYLHGRPGLVGFVDVGYYPTDRLRDEILALPASAGGSPRKLRALYSDACHGETHIADWLRAGFRVASGSVGVDANWSMDLRKFMRAWRAGRTFAYGIARANTVWSTDLMDWIAKGDSTKLSGGEIGFTIDRPLETEGLRP